MFSFSQDFHDTTQTGGQYKKAGENAGKKRE